jgi:dienelactone hydrolase
VPAVRLSPALALKVAMDEVFFLTEVLSASLVSLWAGSRLRDETRAAVDLFERRGWLESPAGYHPAPPPLEPLTIDRTRSGGIAFSHLRFTSGYAPDAEEPGRARWLAQDANQTAHAWVLEHVDRARPWLVCVPGYRMGHPLIDFTGFPAAWLHFRRGLNVVIPVLPLHGPRKAGWRSGDGFLTGDYLDTLHMQAQAVWDVRRVLAWLRARGVGPIGLYGVSLGGYTAALVAALEDDLACVIAGMPASCYVRLARWNLPGFLWQASAALGMPWDLIERLVRVISPLAFVPRVPANRRFLFAGVADRLVAPSEVTALWRHWERPRLAWYDGGHVSFRWERTVRALLHEALETSGLVAA